MSDGDRGESTGRLADGGNATGGSAAGGNATGSLVNDERARRRARRVKWAVRLGLPLFRLLASTWRLREINRAPSQKLRDGGKPVIFALWHGELLPLVWNMRNEGITVLISEHGDGEIIARVAEALGYDTVRGSTSRNGGRALLAMCRTAQNGVDVAFTPDGPRGPARKFAPGALIVAQRTGTPIVALSAAPSRFWRLKSWDGFEVPKPFATINVAFGDPTYVEAATPREATEQTTQFEAVLDRTVAAAHG